MESLVKRYAAQFRLELPSKKPSLISVTSSSSSISSSSKAKSTSSSQLYNVSVASIVLSFDSPPPVKPKDNLKGRKKQ